MNWYLAVLKKYAVFSGRARRKEYWMFTLISVIISLAIGLVEAAAGIVGIGIIYSLAVLLPSLAVSVRRLHDTERSGWWLLLVLIPIIGWLILLVFTVQDSKPNENAYGANPKAVAA